ncbi:formate--tetrahydrofolate ligase [Brevibacterium sp. HMSC063G07]|uniref:formate--tetrahydrofolate ligase n=1 Tax=Brevibacterium sp. HMSC063G07 TaxID=1739261 RepID=UPI0008A206CD|nr:formate--tetrahydrofolate ligase [Brevibacterium sp. HMSC063G07]OFL68945.1 formate--tetrahydrofolate ligase [Brevibacterium sp. HMSC063G07]
MTVDQEIARKAQIERIDSIAQAVGLSADDIIPYGHYKAKVPAPDVVQRGNSTDLGKLILVTAMSPTPAGEGKTTTSIGLADGINQLAQQENWDVPDGKQPAVLALREPSLGPVFGMKGGAAGGGYAQVLPMEDINLHFTGDFNAIALANNLAAAVLDNHLQHGNELGIDPRRVEIRRVVDLNDRALRQIAIGLGGFTGGMPREDAFDIVVASEVMAVFCLATSIKDLKDRLGRIVVARTFSKKPVTVADLGVQGSMAALLAEALSPNLVQSIEHTPAFVHGGPFANIAHGCNSVLATTAAMTHGQYAITEAGFGADLGAEKFLDIKCRTAGIFPSAAVVVATVRALKYHGGVAKADLEAEDIDALKAGLPNLRKHLNNLREVYGIPTVVAVNRFPTDTDAELKALKTELDGTATVAIAEHWAKGGAGAIELAQAVIAAADGSQPQPKFAYELDQPLEAKIEAIATRIYNADGIDVPAKVKRKLDMFTADGYGDLPVCIAKTQYSFSTDAARLGAPTGHTVTVRDVRLSAGAGFIVVICGDIMTMPGLPKRPAALSIDVDDDGVISGLF